MYTVCSVVIKEPIVCSKLVHRNMIAP